MGRLIWGLWVEGGRTLSLAIYDRPDRLKGMLISARMSIGNESMGRISSTTAFNSDGVVNSKGDSSFMAAQVRFGHFAKLFDVEKDGFLAEI